jgi:serine protease Do
MNKLLKRGVWAGVIRATVAAVFLMGMAAWASGNGTADQEVLERTGKAFSKVAKSAIPAVVFIEVEKSFTMGGGPGYYNNPYELYGDEFLRRFFGQGGGMPPRQYRQSGQGSGFIISEDGYILTNNHVVGDVDEIMVTLHDGRKLKARLVGTDPHSEVAVIKVDADKLPFIVLGDSSALDIGEWVIAVGNPFGLSATLTVGVVSATGRNNVGIADYENFIQTDAAINPGNSGGPLLNVKGEAVGINTAIYSRSGGYMGIGFAIPVNMARDIKDQLVTSGRVDRGFLGVYIQDLDAVLAESFGAEDAEGVLIGGVGEDSPAEKAGIESGDIVTKWRGEDISSASAFRNLVAATAPGSEVKMTVLRDGRRRDINVTVGSLDGDELVLLDAGEVRARTGITVDEVTPQVARHFGYEPGEGVVITEVAADSPAERSGLRPGQLILAVNRHAVSSVKDYEDALSGVKDSVLLLVSDGRGSRYVALTLE